MPTPRWPKSRTRPAIRTSPQVLMVTRTANPPGQKQVLEDLRGRGRRRPAGRRACVRLWRLSGQRLRLAVVLHRGHGRPRSVRQSFLTCLVIEGVFERIPNFKLVLIESGFAWLPSLAWRLDKIWNRLKQETPHLKRAPSEYIRESVWLTTQPMEEPRRASTCWMRSTGSAGTGCCSRPTTRTGTTTIRPRCCRCRCPSRSGATSSSTTR